MPPAFIRTWVSEPWNLFETRLGLERYHKRHPISNSIGLRRYQYPIPIPIQLCSITMYWFWSKKTVYTTLYDVESQNSMMMTMYCIAWLYPSPLSLICWQRPHHRCLDGYHVDSADCCLIGIVLGVTMKKKFHPIAILPNICKYCTVPNYPMPVSF